MQRSDQDPAEQALQLTATGGSHNRSTGVWGLPGPRGRPQSVHSSHRYGTPGQGMLRHPFQPKFHPLANILIQLCRPALLTHCPGTQTLSTHAKQSAAAHCQILGFSYKFTYKKQMLSQLLVVFHPFIYPKISSLWLDIPFSFSLRYDSMLSITFSSCFSLFSSLNPSIAPAMGTQLDCGCHAGGGGVPGGLQQC